MSDRTRVMLGGLILLGVWVLLFLGAEQALGEQRPNAALTRNVLDVVAWQVALDQAGFSPGVIDGLVGPKTRRGFRAFQASVELPVTGKADAATLAALGIRGQGSGVRHQAGEFGSESFVRRYVLTEADTALVGPSPQDWLAKSRLTRLGYGSLATLAAERGHCTRLLLAKLNPEVDLDRLKPGDAVMIPNVAVPKTLPQGARLEIDFGSRVVRVFGEVDKVVGLFHCSIAADREQRPEGACKVKTIAMNPSYLFDPAKWPEVKGVDQRLTIPPGPRNPVGVCWIGLSIDGYGIHGTPEPELIGKTGSHGCFRLTNWDVLRLAGMVHVGAEVRFVDSTTRVAAGK